MPSTESVLPFSTLSSTSRHQLYLLVFISADLVHYDYGAHDALLHSSNIDGSQEQGKRVIFTYY